MVMPGLVPGIHMDGRVKPGHDDSKRASVRELDSDCHIFASRPLQVAKSPAIKLSANMLPVRSLAASIRSTYRLPRSTTILDVRANAFFISIVEPRIMS